MTERNRFVGEVDEITPLGKAKKVEDHSSDADKKAKEEARKALDDDD